MRLSQVGAQVGPIRYSQSELMALSKTPAHATASLSMEGELQDLALDKEHVLPSPADSDAPAALSRPLAWRASPSGEA